GGARRRPGAAARAEPAAVAGHVRRPLRDLRAAPDRRHPAGRGRRARAAEPLQLRAPWPRLAGKARPGRKGGSSMRQGVVTLFTLLALVTPLAAMAQEAYPSRPITLVAPFPPGGVADLTARPVAAAMEKVLRNPVVVVNKTGAAGAVGMSFVANSKADGYTLLMALSSISIIPEADKLFDRKPAYTMDQLIPIALISADPTIFVANASRPWKSAKEFVEDAKKHPGEFSYSSSGVYGTLHMAMEML